MGGATRADARGRAPDHSSSRRVGGRFWVLAEGDSEGEADEEENGAPPIGQPRVASPTLSDLLCESLAVGYSEEEVAACVDTVVADSDLARDGLCVGDQVEVLCQIIHRHTAPLAIQPWRGQLPKMSLPSLTLQDLIGPDTWKVVSRRRKKLKRPAANASGAIGEARSRHLNLLLGRDGPDAE